MKKWMLAVMAIALSGAMASAQSRWTITPEAGLTVNKENEGKTATTLGFKVGAGVLYKFHEAEGNRPSFGIKSGLYLLMQKGDYHTWNTVFNPSGSYWSYGDNRGYYYGSYDPELGYGGAGQGTDGDKRPTPGVHTDEMTRYYLQIPVMAHWGFRLADDIHLNLAVGPYVAVAVGGTTEACQVMDGDIDYRTWESFNPFKDKTFDNGAYLKGQPRFDWGGTASAGIEVRRVSFQIGYDLAWGKYHKEQNDLRIRNHQVSFTFGYRF